MKGFRIATCTHADKACTPNNPCPSCPLRDTAQPQEKP